MQSITVTGIFLAIMVLFAFSENYPELKARENTFSFQEELSSTDNRISFADQAYNHSAVECNTSCETFPSNLIAAHFNFIQAEIFELEDITDNRNPEGRF